MKKTTEVVTAAIAAYCLATVIAFAAPKSDSTNVLLLVAHAPAPTTLALPESAFKVKWGASRVPTKMAAGSTVPIQVTITNVGDKAWSNSTMSDPRRPGAYAVRLGYRWWSANSRKASTYPNHARVDLPKPLSPGESATLRFNLAVPALPGDYNLQFDLVQELVAWFESKGAAKSVFSVKVE